MDRMRLSEQTFLALQSLTQFGAEILESEDEALSDFTVRMPCYAAFFSVAESGQTLEHTYERMRLKIAEAKSQGLVRLPRDLELVLLVAGDQPPKPSLVRSIVDNRQLCRKFVVWPNGNALDEELRNLPFWPPDSLLGDSSASIITSVQDALAGHDPALLSDLTSHSPGVQRVFEKIRDSQYTLEYRPSLKKSGRSQGKAVRSLTKLEALSITDFRGITHLTEETMPLSGDVVFIYGPNGVGKTSIADAVEWAISGKVARIADQRTTSTKGSRDPLVNVFSEDQRARVLCRFTGREPIRRSIHQGATKRVKGSQAVNSDRDIIDYIVGTKAPAEEARLPIDRLRNLFRGAHMLAQHDILKFLEEDDPVDRFDILTNMIGAEEYVRFREKTEAVLQHLRSHISTISERNASLNRELTEVSGRLVARQLEIEQLSTVLAGGKNSKDMVSDLLTELTNCQCAIADTLYNLSQGEPSIQDLELIAIHAESAIHARRAGLDELRVHLAGFARDLGGFLESRTRCVSLTVDIASVRQEVEKMRVWIQAKEGVRGAASTNLRSLRTRQADCSKQLTDWSWLKDNVPAYVHYVEAIQGLEKSLPDFRDEVLAITTGIEAKRQDVQSKQIHLREVERVIAERNRVAQALASLLARLPDAQVAHRGTLELMKKESEYGFQRPELLIELETTLSEREEAQTRLQALQLEYEAEAKRHDTLSGFLAKLVELVDQPECPLCGRNYTTVQEAVEGINAHLSLLPVQLKVMTHRLEEMQKCAKEKQAKVEEISHRLAMLENEWDQVRSTKAVMARIVEEFLSECANWKLPLSAANIEGGKAILDKYIKECDTSTLAMEATAMNAEISAIVS